MKTIFEIIDAVRGYRGYSLKELAAKGNIPYTTLASIMSRRSMNISKDTVETIANALDVEFHDIISPEAHRQTLIGSNGAKCITDCTDEFLKSTLRKIIGDDYIQYLPENNLRREKAIHEAQIANAYAAKDERNQFKKSIGFVLDKLNDEGLMEAMRRVLDIANDPKYYVSTDSEKKEDTGWQEEEQ